MNKLLKFSLLGLAISMLASCDLPFGPSKDDKEEEDTTVYHTNLVINGVPDELIRANDYKIRAITYLDEEGDELIPNEPTYGYVDATTQSRVDLKAPFIPGYKFMGWTDDQGGPACGFDDKNIKDGYDTLWNQYQHDGVYTANYQLWTYKVVYGLEEGQSKGPNGLPDSYEYNINKGVVTLADGVSTNLGESFKNWYFYDTSSGVGKEVIITELPTDYFEDTLCIFGNFEIAKHKITVEADVPEGVKTITMVDAIFTDGTLNPAIEILSDHEWNVEVGYYVVIKLELEDNYRGAEVYLDEEFKGCSYVVDGVESSFKFDFEKDIVVRFELFE